jgi:hypothetical protein
VRESLPDPVSVDGAAAQLLPLEATQARVDLGPQRAGGESDAIPEPLLRDIPQAENEGPFFRIVDDDGPHQRFRRDTGRRRE